MTSNPTLEAYVREKQAQKGLLLMTHVVLGYPDFETSWRQLEQMVESGVDLMELQIPFSEPMADGPVIARANSVALAHGATVERCFEFATQAAQRFDIPFLFMSYFNLVFKMGIDKFAQRLRSAGIVGSIVPDLPPEEGEAYLAAFKKEERDPVFIYSPNTSDARLRFLAEHAQGFVYCVARKGVTGASTSFGQELSGYLERCRTATPLPLAVGFGVKSARDVDFLRGKADIAVVGSETIRVLDERGVEAVGPYVRGLLHPT